MWSPYVLRDEILQDDRAQSAIWSRFSDVGFNSPCRAHGSWESVSFLLPTIRAIRDARRSDPSQPETATRPRFCLTDPRTSIHAASRLAMILLRRLQLAVSRARIMGYSFVSPPCHPGAARIFGPRGSVRQNLVV